MAIKKYAAVIAIAFFVTSMILMGAPRSPTTALDQPKPHSIPSEEINVVENGGFETGSFSPWINLGDTSYNQIKTDQVYSGTYSLFMDSHYGDPPYEPVYQEISTTASLDEAPLLSAAVYPTKVGNTCGQAGVDMLTIRINNTATADERNIMYLWSGYTYPGNDMNVNITKVLYLLFDLVPNQWNVIERNLLNDYVDFYGAPADVSDLVVIQITMLSHSSNGDPGDFWVDDITFNYETSTTTTSTTATTDTTTTSDTSNTGTTQILTNATGDFGSWLTLIITGGSGGVIIILVIVIILQRRGGAGAAETVPSGYQW